MLVVIERVIAHIFPVFFSRLSFSKIQIWWLLLIFAFFFCLFCLFANHLILRYLNHGSILIYNVKENDLFRLVPPSFPFCLSEFDYCLTIWIVRADLVFFSLLFPLLLLILLLWAMLNSLCQKSSLKSLIINRAFILSVCPLGHF